MTTAAARPLFRLLGLLLLAVATGAVWFVWLGGDTAKTVDPVTLTETGPYSVAQVAGCVLTLVALLMIAVLAGVRPLPAAIVLTLVFTVVWTVDAASVDDSGLYIIGATLVLGGMAAGTALIAFIASELRKRVFQRA